MRIGNIKNFSSKCIDYSEDEIDIINNLSYCIHCHFPRTILHRIDNKQTKMRICTNTKCFSFTNLNNIKTWIQD